MSYQEQPITKTNDQCEIQKWIIRGTEGREWTLTATRYFELDGSRGKPYWDIRESGDNRRDHDGDVNILSGRFDEGPTKVGVNWACRGTQSIEETLRFKRDLGSAIQAATEAQYIIDHEA